MEKEYSQKYLQMNSGKTVVYEGAETPFFSVSPELSGLADNYYVADYFTSRYDKLKFSRACLVDGGIIIQNIPSQQPDRFLDAAQQLNLASSITMQVVDTRNVTRDIFSLLEESSRISPETLLVFPGNGSQDILRLMGEADIELPLVDTVNLKTERTMIRNGDFSLSVDYTPLPDKKYKNAVIIDDVVASGQTAQEIAYDLRSYYPGISVDVATWLMLPPSNSLNKTIPSGIANVDRTFAGIVVKGNYVSRPPINSLSMFLDDSEMSLKEAIYRNKYIKDQLQFNQTIEKLRGLL
ncbi:hypothetical protein BH09PAT1_BH09PAT1_7630 [soil metagenome]